MSGPFDGAFSSAFDLLDLGAPAASGAPENPQFSTRFHDVVPLTWRFDPNEWNRKTAEVANGIMQGRTNNRGRTTLSISGAGGAVTATPLVDPLVGADSVINFMPRTATAASLMPSLYVSSLTEGQCTLNHPSTDSAAAIYDYVVWS